MKHIRYKRQLKKGRIYAAYSSKAPRKEISFFRLTSKSMSGNIFGDQFISTWIYARERPLDWGVYDYQLFMRESDTPLGTYRLWKWNEFFEVTETEILDHILMETV